MVECLVVELTLTDEGGAVVIAVSGDLDIATADQLFRDANEAAREREPSIEELDERAAPSSPSRSRDFDGSKSGPHSPDRLARARTPARPWADKSGGADTPSAVPRCRLDRSSIEVMPGE